MNKYKMQLINGRVCCKCGSNNINKRFNEVEDTEDYNLHYDTLKCGKCGYWDFPSAFDITLMESDGSEKCPSCGATGKAKLYCHDYFSGQIDLICRKCNKVAPIEKFVGEERWNQFIKDCEEQEKRDNERLAKYIEENDF